LAQALPSTVPPRGGCRTVMASHPSPEHMERILQRIDATCKRVEASRGSLVNFHRAELELLQQLEAARDLMMTVLQSDSGDRKMLCSIFGGDCARVCRVRAVIESLPHLSGQDSSESRRASACLGACESVERVLRDLGLSLALKTAQEREKAALARLQATLAETASATVPSLAAGDEDKQEDSTADAAAAPAIARHEPFVVDEPVIAQGGVAVEQPFEERVEETLRPFHDGSGLDCSDGDKTPHSLALAQQRGLADWTLESLPEESPAVAVSPMDISIDAVLKQPVSIDIVPMEVTLEPMQEPSPEPSPTPLALASAESFASGAVATSENTAPAASVGQSVSPLQELTPMQVQRLSVRASTNSRQLGRGSLSNSPPPVEEKLDSGPGHKDIQFDMLRSLSPTHQQLIRQLFAHYVGPGAMSAGAGLGLSKFRRFLRDCKLLSGDTGPETPRSSSGPETPRSSSGPETPRLLTQAGADLVLVQAAGTVGAGQPLQKLMTADAFARALAHVAQSMRCAAPERPEADALEVLCSTVLVPLGELILGAAGKDVRAAAALQVEPAIAALLKRCRGGLGAVFQRYATGAGAPEPYRRGHWTARSTSRFAADASLVADLSHTLLHQLFSECSAHEACCGRGVDGRLTFGGWQIALIAIAEKIYGEAGIGRPRHPLRRLAVLLLRMSSQLPGAHDLARPSRMAMA